MATLYYMLKFSVRFGFPSQLLSTEMGMESDLETASVNVNKPLQYSTNQIYLTAIKSMEAWKVIMIVSLK